MSCHRGDRRRATPTRSVTSPVDSVLEHDKLKVRLGGKSARRCCAKGLREDVESEDLHPHYERTDRATARVPAMLDPELARS